MLQGVSTAKPPGGGTFTLVQHPASNVSCSGSTCAITLTQTTAAGNLLVYQLYSGNKVSIVSADKGGTITSCSTCFGTAAAGGYVLPSGSTAATSPITVTFSGDVGAWADLKFWEFHPSANPNNVAFDGGYSIHYLSGVTPVGPSFTFTGTNDVSVQACGTANSCTAASSPFNTNFETDADGVGWTNALNLSNGTGPTWTLSSVGATDLIGMAFGFNAANPARNYVFTDFAGQSSTVSAAKLTSGSHCPIGEWGGTFTTTAFSTSSPAPINMLGSLSSCGTSYSGNTGIVIDRDTTTNDVATYTLINPLPHFISGFWWNSSTPSGTVSNGEQCDISSIESGSEAIVPTLRKESGTIYLEAERTNTTTFWGQVPYTMGTDVLIVLQYNAGSSVKHKMAVYDSSGNQIATNTNGCAGDTSTICIDSTASATNATIARLFRVGSCYTNASHQYYSNVIFDAKGDWPMAVK